MLPDARVNAAATKQRAAPTPTWDGPEYARVTPGRYSAVATRVKGPTWVRRYQRWSCAIEFSLLAEDKRVCAFFNMGSDPQRPHAGPQSRYFRAWSLANGELPRHKQGLDPAVFLDGQVFEIEVADCGTDAEGLKKADALVYSRATAILSAERRVGISTINTITQSAQSPRSRASESLNHESGITQSRNQESPNQVGQGEKTRSKASPGPGGGTLTHKQPQRAGVSAPAQARRPLTLTAANNNSAPLLNPTIPRDANWETGPTAWRSIQEMLKKSINIHSFETWLKPCRGIATASGVLFVHVPLVEFQQVLETKYHEPIQAALEKAGLQMAVYIVEESITEGRA
jgi:hypothetical protein